MKRLLLLILLLLCLLSPVTAQERPRLDLLDPSLIPAEERFADQPKELVAILGSGQGRHWTSLSILAQSPDGKYLACNAADGAVRLLDSNSLRPVALFGESGYNVTLIAFSSDSKMLATSEFVGEGIFNSHVKLWEVPTGKLRVTLKAQFRWPSLLVFSPDGHWLAGGGGALAGFGGSAVPVSLWDLTKSPPEEEQPRGHQNAITAATFTPDSKTLLTADSSGEIRSWQVAEKKHIGAQTVPGQSVQSLAFSQDGKTLLACSRNKSVQMLDCADGKLAKPVQLKDTNGTLAMALSADGKRLATLAESGRVQLWNLVNEPFQKVATIERIRAFRLGQTPANPIVLSPDGKVLSEIAGWRNTVHQWDLSGPKPKERPLAPGAETRLRFIAWSADGRRIVAADEDSNGWLWDWQMKQFGEGLGWSLKGDGTFRGTFAASPDLQSFAAAGNQGIDLWDLSQRPPRRGPDIAGEPKLRRQWSALAFALTGKWLAASGYDEPSTREGYFGFDLLPDQPKLRFAFESSPTFNVGTRGLAFSPDGKKLAIGVYKGKTPLGGNEEVGLYDIPSGKEIWSFSRPKSHVQAIAFSSDGRTLAISWREGHVTLVEVAMRQPRAEFDASVAGPNAFAFSKDGELLATAGNDGQVTVWEGSKKRSSATISGGLLGVAWAPDNRHLATANANGTVYILRVR